MNIKGVSYLLIGLFLITLITADEITFTDDQTGVVMKDRKLTFTQNYYNITNNYINMTGGDSNDTFNSTYNTFAYNQSLGAINILNSTYGVFWYNMTSASGWRDVGTNVILDNITDNVGIGIISTSSKLSVNTTSINNHGVYIFSENATPSGSVNLLTLETKNTTWNRPLLRIIDNSTAGGSANIRIDSPNPDIELVEIDSTTPEGKFELAVQSDVFQINGRNEADDSFEPIAFFRRYADGGTMGIGTMFDIPNAMIEIVPSNKTAFTFAISKQVGANSGDILSIENDTGYFGLNNTNPNFIFHVNGNGFMNGNFNVSSTSDVCITGVVCLSSAGGGVFGYNHTAIVINIIQDNNASWLSTFNSTYNQWNYNQTGATANVYGAGWNSTFNSTYSPFAYNQTSASGWLDVGTTVRLITSTDKVAIGSTGTPLTTTHIFGNLTVSENATIGGYVFINNSRLGIGTASPTHPVNIIGHTNISGHLYHQNTITYWNGSCLNFNVSGLTVMSIGCT